MSPITIFAATVFQKVIALFEKHRIVVPKRNIFLINNYTSLDYVKIAVFLHEHLQMLFPFDKFSRGFSFANKDLLCLNFAKETIEIFDMDLFICTNSLQKFIFYFGRELMLHCQVKFATE